MLKALPRLLTVVLVLTGGAACSSRGGTIGLGGPDAGGGSDTPVTTTDTPATTTDTPVTTTDTPVVTVDNPQPPIDTPPFAGRCAFAARRRPLGDDLSRRPLPLRRLLSRHHHRRGQLRRVRHPLRLVADLHRGRLHHGLGLHRAPHELRRQLHRHLL